MRNETTSASPLTIAAQAPIRTNRESPSESRAWDGTFIPCCCVCCVVILSSFRFLWLLRELSNTALLGGTEARSTRLLLQRASLKPYTENSLGRRSRCRFSGRDRLWRRRGLGSR